MDHNSIFLLAFWNSQGEAKTEPKRNSKHATAAVASITQYLLVSLALPQRISYHCDKRKEHLSSLTIYEMRLLASQQQLKMKMQTEKMRENFNDTLTLNKC